jgi:ribosomal protein S18 acetylase RimI-like enzyme
MSIGRAAAISIRESTPDDIAALAMLKHSVEDETYSRYGTAWEHVVSLRDYCSEQYITELRAQFTVFVAIAEQGETVGMVAVDASTELAAVSSLYCSMPGRGIGTSLLLSALEGLPDYAIVRLEVFEANRTARQYFEALGLTRDRNDRPSESYLGQMLLGMKGTVGGIRRKARTTC